MILLQAVHEKQLVNEYTPKILEYYHVHSDVNAVSLCVRYIHAIELNDAAFAYDN